MTFTIDSILNLKRSGDGRGGSERRTEEEEEWDVPRRQETGSKMEPRSFTSEVMVFNGSCVLG